MRTRIEIFNGEWTELFLGSEKEIKYNLVANRINTISQREISHSNTFVLPYIFPNIKALGINVFNPRALAEALNTKYKAKYYVNDKLNQEGYLVINNTDNGVINVNFIDVALGIVEKWSSVTFYDLLNSDSADIPDDYKASISSMKSYNMSKTSILTPLAEVGTRGYNLAIYPNNLNPIGDKFQIPANGNRLSDTFNPYQSRPIFNVKAFLDLSIETFGYTPYYDSSIDWNKLEKTYMIEKDLSQSQKEESSFLTKTFEKVLSNDAASKTFVNGFIADHYVNFTYPLSGSTFFPADLSNYISIPGGEYSLKDYKVLDRCIVELNPLNRTSGTVNWKGILDGEQRDGDLTFKAYAIWRGLGPMFGYSIGEITAVNNSSESRVFDITVDKAQFVNKPTGVLEVMGVALVLVNKPKKTVLSTTSTTLVTDMVFTETYLPTGVISYDKYDQYEADVIDLRHATPKNTIKELLSSIMQKEGILMSFNNRLKIIKLYSYSSYLDRKNEGNFSDWSEYHQEYELPLFNTNYGNEYAKINEIGLSSPYKGNTYKLVLANQGISSKYTDFTQSLNSKFKDVEKIQLVNNTNTPYYEYTNKGLGLVEIGEQGLGTLTQVRADGGSQGTFTGLTSVYNVNYAILPKGVISWYNLIDKAVRAQATFLIPLEVIKDLDLAEPIYVSKLGGFYIIEEIPEYTNSQTPVEVKLIKLLVDDSLAAPTPKIPNYSSQYSDSYSK